MLLDYVARTGAYTLRVGRDEGVDIQALMKEHGLDLSSTASNASNAILFTREPFAAATFAKHATPIAVAAMGGILGQIDASWKSHGTANIACPPDKELWPFQVADIEYCLQRKNSLVADQPGLGKTPVAICFANEIRAKRVLVLCPANIRLQWCMRIREWTTMRWPFRVYPILGGRHGVDPTAEWTVVSYDLARTEGIGRALARGTYDLIILDEAHYLKTIDSNRTQATFGDLETGWYRRPIRNSAEDIIGYEKLFEGLASRCGAILALTGTPLPNRPREAYTLARNLNWDSIDWMSESKFADRFNPSMKMEEYDPETKRTKIWIDERSGRHSELQNRLRASFMTRHLKRDVMGQLKLPVLDIVYVEESGAVKAALKAESLLDIDPDTFKPRDEQTIGQFPVVRHMMGIAIAPLAAEYAAMVLDGGEEKIVLFAWHRKVLDILQERLGKYGLLRIDGSTSGSRKQSLVDEFIQDRNKRILLGNMQSIGVGTDGLQAVCSHAIFAEQSPVPGDNEQCVDRLDRGGQTRTVQADFLVAPGSLGEKILQSAIRKKNNTHNTLDRRL